jgi:hypothetical protein
MSLQRLKELIEAVLASAWRKQWVNFKFSLLTPDAPSPNPFIELVEFTLSGPLVDLAPAVVDGDICLTG